MRYEKAVLSAVDDASREAIAIDATPFVRIARHPSLLFVLGVINRMNKDTGAHDLVAGRAVLPPAIEQCDQFKLCAVVWEFPRWWWHWRW